MQTTVENLGQLARRMDMSVPVSEIDREVEQRLKRLARTVKLHGFRPGKVPFKVVVQQYGYQVRSEVIGDAVQRAFTDSVRTQNLRVAGFPKIEAKERGEDAAEFEFSATFEVYPDVTLGDLGAAKVERPQVTVGDAEVDKTLGILRRQRAIFNVMQRAATGTDRVTFDFSGRIDGQPFEGGEATGHVAVLGEGQLLAEFEAQIVGVDVGGQRNFEVTFPGDYHGKEVAGKTAKFDLTLRGVEEVVLPELSAEFARSLGVASGDVEKLRDEVRGNLMREVNRRVQAAVKEQVMEALISATNIELPKALIEAEMGRLREAAVEDLKGRGAKVKDTELPAQLFEQPAKRRVNLGLIVAELVKSNSLEAKPEQIRKLIEEHAQSFEQPEAVIQWYYSQPKRLGEMEALALEDNVVEWVLARAQVTDKSVAFDELMGTNA